MQKYQNVEKKWLFIVGVFLVFTSGAVHAQKAECRALLNNYVQQMGKIGVPEEGKVYFIEMEVTAVPRNTVQPPVKRLMKTYVMHDQLIYHSEPVSMYKDLNNVYVVLHEVRRILIEENHPEDSVAYKKDQMLNFQLGLIENSEIFFCQDVNQNGIKMKLIVLKPDETLKKTLKVDKISIYVDAKTKMVKEVMVAYDDKYPIQYQKIKYLTLDFKYKELDTEIPVSTYLFEQSGELVKDYRGYELVDNRR